MPRRTAIGLDIGTSVVRAVELSFGRNGITLERFGQLVLPPDAVHDGQVVDGDAVAKALRKLWTATKLTHRQVVLGVANQRVIVRQLELPWLARNELSASLPFQVQDLLPMPVDQAVLDYFPVEELTDPELRGYLDHAARHGTPRPESQAIRAHVPAVLRSFSENWNRAFRAGVCEHHIKELCRVYVSKTIDCHY